MIVYSYPIPPNIQCFPSCLPLLMLPLLELPQVRGEITGFANERLALLVLVLLAFAHGWRFTGPRVAPTLEHCRS